MCLNPGFNSCSNFVLSWVDKVKKETKSFVWVTANIVALVAEEITQFWDQVQTRLISLLIKDISRVLQKLLKYFKVTAILTPFVLPAVGDFLLF